MSMNLLIACGNLTTDVSIRDVNGASCANFGLAVNTTQKGEDGKYLPMFYSVDVWRKRGETCAQYLKKGGRVVVAGELSQRPYVDKEGKDRVQNKITATRVDFQGGGKPLESSETDDLPF